MRPSETEIAAGFPAVAAVTPAQSAPFDLVDVELDALRAGEVRVEMRATGICHTDLAARDGHLPFPLPAVLGHEGTGIVDEVGSGVTQVVPGDRVVMSFASCGACLPCRTGRPVQCTHWLDLNLLGGSRLDGTATIRRPPHVDPHGHFFGQSSFATHAISPERGLVKIESDVAWSTLAPLGCSAQTGAGTVLTVLAPCPGETIAVFGCGAVGLAAIIATRLTPATAIIAIDPIVARRELAKSLGATAVIDPASDDVIEAIRGLTAGRGVDCVLEATGKVEVLRASVDSLAVNGRCAVIGAPPFGSEVRLDVPAMLARNPQVFGVNQGLSVPQELIPALVSLHEQGRFPIDRLITTFPFNEINEAAAASEAATVVKPVLLFQ